MFTQENHVSSSKSLRIKHFTYGEHSYSASKQFRATGVEPNPIKVVVDMIGEDGNIHQKIIKENYQLQLRQPKSVHFKFKKSVPKKYDLQPQQLTNPPQSKQPKDNNNHQSIVFNRYNYDNYQSLPMYKGKNSSPSKRKISNPNHKNIEIVFCQSKLPQFVSKTNEKIEQIYKQEKIVENTQRKQALIKSQYQSLKARQSVVKPAPKTNFSNCLKQYATLQKLSLFMENDRNIKNKHFCNEQENDPSRNLLLDIITHRFNFLKNLSNKVRDRIYRSLLAREIHNQTKINIKQYMKLYEMFIGKDAKASDIATFMYIFLFGNQVPAIELAADQLQRVNGQIHRLRYLLKEIQSAMQKNSQSLVQTFCDNEKLLRQFIDYIVEK